MNVQQQKYTWEDEWEQQKQRHKQAVDKLYSGTYGAKPVLPRRTLFTAIVGIVVTCVVVRVFVYLVFSLPFGH